jgi:hypothetical protein
VQQQEKTTARRRWRGGAEETGLKSTAARVGLGQQHSDARSRGLVKLMKHGGDETWRWSKHGLAGRFVVLGLSSWLEIDELERKW